MFARLFAVASLAAIAVAGNSHLAARQQCNTGDINCCDNQFQAQDLHKVLSQYGIDVLADVTGLAASGCSSMGVVGALNSGASCSQQPLCCDNNEFNGAVVVGCSPINLNL